MITYSTGWLCGSCGTITLEWRRTRPMACPQCHKTEWKNAIKVAKIGDTDFHRLIRIAVEGKAYKVSSKVGG